MCSFQRTATVPRENRKEINDMQKKFYITKCSEKGEASPPETDRFKQVEHLNELLDLGWRIVELRTENCDTYFILEKQDRS